MNADELRMDRRRFLGAAAGVAGAAALASWGPRALGKPGGRQTLTSCATDPDTGEEVCSVGSAVLVRDSGRSKFTNVSPGQATTARTQ